MKGLRGNAVFWWSARSVINFYAAAANYSLYLLDQRFIVLDKITERHLRELDAELQALMTRLGELDDDLLNRSPDADTWSVIQVMHHLILAEGKSMQYVRKKMHYTDKFKPADLGSRFRTALVCGVLRSPIKRKAPAGVSGEHLPEYATLADTAATWRAQRDELTAFFRQLPDDIWDKQVYKHPFGGRMTLAQMLEFFRAHFATHRRQIGNTIEQLTARA